MAMTRRDYIAVSNVLARTHKGIRTLAQRGQLTPQHAHLAVDLITREMAAILAEDNPRFNTTMFLRQSGYTSPTPDDQPDRQADGQG